LTDMEAPLGVAVGNAIETREAIEVLHGRGPPDTVEVTYALGAEMLLLAGKAATEAEARAVMKRAIDGGDAARTMERMIEAQKGDPRVVGDPSRLELARVSKDIVARRVGFVTAVDALAIGRAAVAMGAGRARAEDSVNPAVGLEVLAKPGTKVERGAPLARVYLSAESAEIEERVASAFTIGDEAPAARPLLVGRVT
jgi:thymidine phosphorylase